MPRRCSQVNCLFIIYYDNCTALCSVSCMPCKDNSVGNVVNVKCVA